MTAAERSSFLLARRGGVGGSDAASLLSPFIEVEYGCRRRLWYDKSGFTPDDPDAQTEFTMLGNILEPYIRAAYQYETGRTVEEVSRITHPTIPCLGINVDGIIHPAPDDTRTTNGTLEVKAVGKQMMRKMSSDGICVDYLCQLNAGMSCNGHTYGAFSVGVREDIIPLVAIQQAAQLTGEPPPYIPRRAKIEYFEMERSPEICEMIEREAPLFWETLSDESRIPSRLDPEDPRCGRCAYQVRCQGAAVYEGAGNEIDIPRRPDLLPLAAEYRERAEMLEAAESLVKETQNKFRAALDTVTAVKLPVLIDGVEKWKNVLYRVRKGGEYVDGKALSHQYEALREAAIKAGLPGVELTAPTKAFSRKGMPSRPLLLKGLLPPKPKKRGETPEVDGAEDEDEE